MKTHRLKVFIKYADAIMNGTKTFEIRKNDRGYEVGDKTAGPMRGRDLPTSSTARARISSIVGELVPGA